MSDDPASTLPRRRVLATIGTVGLSGCVTLERRESTAVPGTLERRELTQRASVSAGTTCQVDNRNGNVTVRSGDGGEVVVEIEKRTRDGSEYFDDVDVDLVQQDGVLTVETTVDTLPTGVTVSVNLDLVVPEGTTVEHVATQNGNVTVRSVAGDVRASTNNGDIELEKVDGIVRAETSNGSIESEAVAGFAGARTNNGYVDVAVLTLPNDASAHSTNGDVTVRVSPTLDAECRLATSTGDVSVGEVGLTIDRQQDDLIEGQLGKGGPRLTAETTNGNVELRPL